MKVGEDNYEIFEKVSKMTMTNYEINWWDAENIKGYIDPDTMLYMIEDLICEVERLEERIEDIIQDRDDNYKPIPYEEQIDYNPRDFY